MTDQDEKEVKPDDTDTDSTEVEEDGDDIVNENDTQSESSADEKQGESDEEESDNESDDSEEGEQEGLPVIPTGGDENNLKRQPNESAREFALRLELTRMKRKMRKEKVSDIFQGGDIIKAPKKTDDNLLTEDEMEFLKQIPEDELKGLEKVLGIVAKKKGWVQKEELQATTFQSKGEEMLESFLEEHPEYNSDNDSDNILWNQFKSEFALYKTPSNPKDLKKIFNKIHKEIFEVLPESKLNSVNAQKQKLKSASHSGAAQTRKISSPRSPQIDPSLKQHLKGFEDGELGEMFGE